MFDNAITPSASATCGKNLGAFTLSDCFLKDDAAALATGGGLDTPNIPQSALNVNNPNRSF